jgi:hypothetical protein
MLILQRQEGRLETYPNILITRCQPEPSGVLGQIEEIYGSMHLPNDFWIAMEKGAAHTTTNAGTMNNIPPPFTISTHPGCMQLREAFKEQSKIGWINVLKGQLSTLWQDFVRAHLKVTKSRFKADEWAAKVVAAL